MGISREGINESYTRDQVLCRWLGMGKPPAAFSQPATMHDTCRPDNSAPTVRPRRSRAVVVRHAAAWKKPCHGWGRVVEGVEAVPWWGQAAQPELRRQPRLHTIFN